MIERKVREELGNNIEYKLGGPIVFFRVERFENNTQEMVKIFAIGYEAQHLKGEIELGDHHDQLEWVNVASFVPEDYFTGGGLKGVKEYLEIKKNNE